MVPGDLLRLAWEAEHDGRSKLRDSLLTLAVTESLPGDDWAERGRARLLLDRPDHFLSQFPTVSEALGDPRVILARDRLRAKYPPARVEWLLLRASARRGPFHGRTESLAAMIEDLVGYTSAEAENVRLDAPQASRGPLIRQKSARPVAWALSYPPISRSNVPTSFRDDPEPPSNWDPSEETAEEFAIYYTTVLLALAFLLATIRQGQDAPNQ